MFESKMAMDMFAHNYHSLSQSPTNSVDREVSGRVSDLKSLVKSGAKPDERNSLGKTALHVAVENNKYDAAKFLVEITDLSIKDYGGWTVLHWAAKSRSPRLVKLILVATSDVNPRDSYSQTPLHLAASSGHVGVVKALVQAKAQLDAKDGGENTPLQIASALQTASGPGVVKILVNALTAQTHGRKRYRLRSKRGKR